MKTILPLLFMLFALNLFGQNDLWVKIYSNKDMDVYINKDRITWSGNVCNAWAKWIYHDGDFRNNMIARNIKFRNGENAEKWNSLLCDIDNVDYACDINMTKTKNMIFYERNGLIIESLSPDDPKWEQSIPGSVGDIILNKLCESKTTGYIKPEK